MQVIVDSSFITHCVRKNIDFVKELEARGYSVVVPREVLQELRHNEHDNKTSVADKELLGKVITLLDDHKRFKRVSAGGGRVSDWLIKQDSAGVHIATHDKSLKHKLVNKISIDDSGKIVG